MSQSYMLYTVDTAICHGYHVVCCFTINISIIVAMLMFSLPCSLKTNYSIGLMEILYFL